MNTYDFDLSADENSVLNYLNNHAEEFISEMELSRRAEGRHRFMEDPHWAHSALSRLMESNLVKSDGFGRYRVSDDSTATTSEQPNHPGRRFIDPRLRTILERSGHAIDLSQFA